MKLMETKKLFNLLNISSTSNQKAKDIKFVSDEIDKVLFNLESHLKNMNADKAIKKILWQGILNQFGTYGSRSGQLRKYKKNDYKGNSIEYHYNHQFTKGSLLSIDFGTSNIDRELSLTHTGIVLADYTDMVIVVPITSKSSLDYENLSMDIKKDIMILLKKDYPQIENDSYVLTYQLRAVSKNRITQKGIVGTFDNTVIMDEIENKIISMFSFDRYKKQQDKINELEEELINLKKLIDNN